jgi:hypothetical protein
MNNIETVKTRINWARGIHRVFLLLCVIWALFVWIGLPVMQARQASDFAVMIYGFNIEHPAKDSVEQADRQQTQRTLFEESTLPSIYKVQVLPNLHWFLLGALLPPAILYGLARAVIALVRWLYRGFATP